MTTKTIKTFPTLYSQNSDGSVNEWTISVEAGAAHGSPGAGVIVTKYGRVGGAVQSTIDVVTEGKNAGKANETLPDEQALKEAKSKWTKKKKSGYVEKLKDAEAGKVDDIIEGGVEPMLAQKYRDHSKKVVWPAYCQPKLDGIRCIAIVKNGKCSLWTRTRKPIKSVPHIVAFLEEYFSERDVVLDGELYNHDLKSDFEKIVSAVRKDEPAPGNEVIEYHVYDVICEGNFDYRATQLLHLPAGGIVQYVPTHKMANEAAMQEFFAICMEEGYEGCMVRNANSPYENKRSYGLQKVKEFDDAEFEITGVEEGRGKMAGKAIFVCKTKKGDTFNCKMKGKIADLAKYLKAPNKVIGKKLTVRYFGMTNGNVPRFPVGIVVRDYE